jgi:uracil-DNA glycosylase
MVEYSHINIDLKGLMPSDWREILLAEFTQSYFEKLEQFLAEEIAQQIINPKYEDIFSAFRYTAYQEVKVMILGQDPYHGPGQAHGLSFSVLPGVPLPPSIKNIFKEMHNDLGTILPNNGYLLPWAKQGVLMLNAVLTVRAGEAATHKNRGWEKFTGVVISRLSERKDPMVFVLWGDYAKKKRKLIDESRHIVIEGIHPSPLSAHNGFFGSRPFSKINSALQQLNNLPIDWQLPNLF